MRADLKSSLFINLPSLPSSEFQAKVKDLSSRAVIDLPSVCPQVRSLGREDLLEEEMATHSSIPA